MVGLGRRLRVAPEDGPRARLGVGALEAPIPNRSGRIPIDAGHHGGYMRLAQLPPGAATAIPNPKLLRC